MIYRCADKFGGRWCPVCHKCACSVRNEKGSRVWAGKPNPKCPMHGTNVVHPNGKVIDYDYVMGPRGMPVKLIDQPTGIGWDV